MPKSKWHIPPEAREDATHELFDLADRMFRGGQSLMQKAMRLQDPDPKVRWAVIGDLRRYAGNGMPCAEEMVRIEAILRGMPEDQCFSEIEKKRQAKAEHNRLYEEAWKRVSESDDPRREWENYAKIGARRMLALPKVGQRPDGVIIGPWGEAP